MRMVQEFEEQAVEMGWRSMFKEASRYAEELGFELDLEQLQTIKVDVKKCQVQKLGEEVKNSHSCKSMLICLVEDQRKAQQ